MQKQSLYRAAFEAAETYRDELEGSVDAEMLPQVVSHWNQERWWRWVVSRVIEHLQGDAYWTELDGDRFSSVSEENPNLSDTIFAIREIEGALDADELMPFDQKIQFIDRWADLANQLLE